MLDVEEGVLGKEVLGGVLGKCWGQSFTEKRPLRRTPWGASWGQSFASTASACIRSVSIGFAQNGNHPTVGDWRAVYSEENTRSKSAPTPPAGPQGDRPASPGARAGNRR